MSATREHTPYLVVSWNPRRPRATVRLDGYYFVRAHAAGVAAHERESFGRHALLLEVLTPRTAGPIPDVLFKYDYALHPVPAARSTTPRDLGWPRRLRRLRYRLGLTQPGLARRLGVAGVTIGKWEQGLNAPHHAIRPAIAVLEAEARRAWLAEAVAAGPA